MTSTKFKIRTHVVPGQHIRYFDRGNRGRDEDAQRLEAKQYIPLNNPDPRDGDVTIIGACATSFPKEVYEPLWEELIMQCESSDLRIRSIWIADRNDHAASAALNGDVLGDDHSPFDHARDLLHMVNVYREEFTLPIIGFGHSMGGTSLLELARLHPRLFASLILVEPITGPGVFKIGVPLIYGAAQRPDVWPSREDAARFLKQSAGMKRWHPAALQAYLDHGLRDTPTALYPEPGKVTLSTSKANESFAYARPCFERAAVLEGADAKERGFARYPDWDWDLNLSDGHPFYRSEAMRVWRDLPLLRPSVLYVVPQYGPFGLDPRQLEALVGQTGTGNGGSGGRETGRVKQAFLKGRTHLVPVEAPEDCARAMVSYLVPELRALARRRRMAKEDGEGKRMGEVALSEEWKRQTKIWLDNHGPKRKAKI